MMHHPAKEASHAAGRRHAGKCLRAGLAGLAVFALAACEGREQPVDHATPVPDTHMDEKETNEPWPERVTPLETDGEAALPPKDLLARVLADASERSDIPSADLVIDGAWRRTWSDGSLGCPRPGEFYTQALVPGWQVIVKAGEQELDYRLTDRGHFILCPDGLAQDGGFIER
jgi:hypothetical protein